MTRSKRTVDLLGAGVGLLLITPLFPVIAAAVWLEDGGSVFFRQIRIGRFGKPFEILKFRTMGVDAEKSGPPVTVGRDTRITRVGRVLRHWKLDELPQLWNVIRGDMSLIGPRPDVPDMVERYTHDQRRVLQLVPGMTDPASIRYRDEAALLAMADDPQRLYLKKVVPEKIRLNLEYANRATTRSDLLEIMRTFASVFVGRGR